MATARGTRPVYSAEKKAPSRAVTGNALTPTQTEPSATHGYHHGANPPSDHRRNARCSHRAGIHRFSIERWLAWPGVSAAAPYHHFKDRDAIFAAIAMQGFRHFTRSRPPRLTAAHCRRIAHLAQVYVTFAIDHPGHYQVMFSPKAQRRDHLPRKARGRRPGLFRRCLRLIESSRPKSTEEEQRILAITVWSTAHGFVSLWQHGPLRDKPDLPGFAPLVAALADNIATMLLRS
ncbi:MAG: TetR-like C-terminal domain-containing protein [Polyangiaceae bacterium]